MSKIIAKYGFGAVLINEETNFKGAVTGILLRKNTPPVSMWCRESAIKKREDYSYG